MKPTTAPDGWRMATLSELGEVNRGRSRHRPRYAEHLYGGEYPFIQTGDVKASGGRISTYSQTYSDAGLAQSRLWPAGTMCITIAANIAESGVLGFDACFPDSVVGFVPDPAKANVHFIQYAFRMLKSQLQHEASGSVQDNINLGTLERTYLAIPAISEQNAIAEVLGALDDKIAVNTSLSNIADEWIRAEYDLLTTLSSEHRALSEIVINRRNTANPEMLEAKIPYVGLEHIPRRLMWLGEHGSSDEVSSNKSHFKAGDILFGKLRPYFHKIVTAPKAGICSTDVLVLTPVDEALSGFALASLAHDGVVQAVTSASEGTRMPRTSWKELSSINVPWPGQEAAASFSTRVSAIRNYVIGLMAENQTLAATRDALLPQLMSGKLRVKGAEALVESAV